MHTYNIYIIKLAIFSRKYSFIYFRAVRIQAKTFLGTCYTAFSITGVHLVEKIYNFYGSSNISQLQTLAFSLHLSTFIYFYCRRQFFCRLIGYIAYSKIVYANSWKFTRFLTICALIWNAWWTETMDTFLW